MCCIYLGICLLPVKTDAIQAQLVNTVPTARKRTFRAYIVDDRGLPVDRFKVTLKLRNPELLGLAPGAKITYGPLRADKRGWFLFPEIPEGDYKVTVKAPGHEPVEDMLYTLGMFSPPVRVTLNRYATLTLRVFGVDGGLLRNVPLVLSFSDTKSQKKLEDQADWRLGRKVMTDKNGIVTVAELAPSEYHLYAVLRGQGYGLLNHIVLAPGAGPKPKNLSLYESGTLQIKVEEAPASLNVNSMDEKTFTSRSGWALGGAFIEFVNSILLHAGAEDFKPSVHMLNLTLGKRASELVTRDGDGWIEWTDLPPTDYEVRIVLAGFHSPTQSVEIKAGETASVQFELHAQPTTSAKELRVLVHDGKGVPVANRELRIYLQPHSPTENLDDYDPWRRARTDADGRFTLYPMPAGTWKIDLTFPCKEGAALYDNDHLTTETKTVTVPADNVLVEFDLRAARHRN
jgi:hypothetical protein